MDSEAQQDVACALELGYDETTLTQGIEEIKEPITYFPLRVSHEVEIPPGFRIQVLS
jgi:hypothetical protein